MYRSENKCSSFLKVCTISHMYHIDINKPLDLTIHQQYLLHHVDITCLCLTFISEGEEGDCQDLRTISNMFFDKAFILVFLFT